MALPAGRFDVLRDAMSESQQIYVCLYHKIRMCFEDYL
jgi:hypothetical protein